MHDLHGLRAGREIWTKGVLPCTSVTVTSQFTTLNIIEADNCSLPLAYFCIDSRGLPLDDPMRSMTAAHLDMLMSVWSNVTSPARVAQGGDNTTTGANSTNITLGTSSNASLLSEYPLVQSGTKWGMDVSTGLGAAGQAVAVAAFGNNTSSVTLMQFDDTQMYNNNGAIMSISGRWVS